MSNKQLTKTRLQKNDNDEFLTQLDTIENEIPYYKNELKNKIVYSNTDSTNSNFYKYFSTHFDDLGLKDFLICDKDFRSQESIDLLKCSDIVITNPPFSLWREYLQQLIQYNKKFIILGTIHMAAYKITIPHIVNENIFLGKSLRNKITEFQVPSDYKTNIVRDGKKYLKVNGIRWFTNLGKPCPQQSLKLTKKYDPNNYERYVNCSSAINVDKIKDIPMDYDGLIGTPITILDKINYDQFKIFGVKNGDDGQKLRLKNKVPFLRVLIARPGFKRKNNFDRDLFYNH